MKNPLSAWLTLSCLLALVPTAVAQNGYQVTYSRSSNGSPIENQDLIVTFAFKGHSTITSAKILEGKASFPFEQTSVDVNDSSIVQWARLSETRSAKTIDSSSFAKQQFELQEKTKTVLGHKCKLATTVINSNRIEIWYADDLGVNGGPSALGQKLGLVLEMVRNGNYVVTATKIRKIRAGDDVAWNSYPKTDPYIDAPSYRDLLWKSRFTTIEVFRDEIINFSDASKSNDSILRFANGTIIVRKVRIPKIKKGSQVFIDVTERSNGDAYDRTGSAFLIPTDLPLSFLDGLQHGIATLPVYDNGNGKKYQGVIRQHDYEPLLELMRFFTPFGVGKYNTIELKGKTWQDSVLYRQDISDFIPRLSDREVYIGLNIGNYDKGGHRASLHLTIHDEEEGVAPKPATEVLGLFDTMNVMEMAGQEYGTMFSSEKGLELTFDLENDLKNARLRYITTGHGGWEKGDEFVPKKNRILLDGTEIFAFTPWRTDCGSYRMSNPASGNFPNGLSSSDYSRSNWCPGTTTNPIWIDLGNLKAGKHTVQVKIPLGASEGGSFSAWNVSGVLIGDRE